MSRARLVSCWMMVIVGALVATAAVPEATAEDKPDAGGAGSVLPGCISVTADARYIPYGYNHVVILKSGCSKPATCRVATDVSPAPISVEVAAKATVEVLTFTASPAQVFTPIVSCRLR